MNETQKTTFVPQLIIQRGTKDVNFYKNAFGAIELRRWVNDDDSIHVSELSIDGALFHLHEENPTSNSYSPRSRNGVTAIIGLMVDDVDAVMARAIQAGAKEVSPAKDYEYNYRQGEVEDPYGHYWLIEKEISIS